MTDAEERPRSWRAALVAVFSLSGIGWLLTHAGLPDQHRAWFAAALALCVVAARMPMVIPASKFGGHQSFSLTTLFLIPIAVMLSTAEVATLGLVIIATVTVITPAETQPSLWARLVTMGVEVAYMVLLHTGCGFVADLPVSHAVVVLGLIQCLATIAVVFPALDFVGVLQWSRAAVRDLFIYEFVFELALVLPLAAVVALASEENRWAVFGPALPFAMLVALGRRVLHSYELELQALIDPLTSLRNRRGVYSEGAALVRRAREQGRSVAVILGDLDHFKAVNDTHGHAVGDDVLRRVGAHLATLVDEDHLAARWGGEEVLLLVSHDTTSVADLAEQVRLAVADMFLDLGVTISIGIGSMDPKAMDDWSALDEATLIDGLVVEADGFLYEAKGAGRNQVIGRAA